MELSYPIILVHGICPFHRVFPFVFNKDNATKDVRHYFKGVRSLYRQNGIDAYHARLSWAAGLDHRATDLMREIVRFTEAFGKYQKVHIIAHSMGGLDARWMMHRFQISERIASLTTIGTPHHGTTYAERALKRFGKFLDFIKIMGLDLEGLKALTPEACYKMNSILERSERQYQTLFRTVAGAQPLEDIFLPLRRSYKIIMEQEGENDGLVSVRSAMWKRQYLMEVIHADHLNQIGWWDGGKAMGARDKVEFEKRIAQFYLDLALELQKS